MYYNSFIDIPLNQLSAIDLDLTDNKTVLVTFDVVKQLSAQVEENKKNISLIYNELIPRWSIGDGSETNPYLIYNIHDFIILDKALKFGFNSEGKYFKQMCDIDLSGITWEGIGNHDKNYFKGIYDGNNKKVTNFTLCKNDYCGLFNGIAGTEQNRCIIKNLEVSCNGVEVDPEDTVLWGSYSPIIARGGNGYITLENLTARGNIGSEEVPVGKDCAGGIIGKIEGTESTATVDLPHMAILTNCTNYTDIYINISAYGKAGGIAAYMGNGAQLSNCINYGKIIYNGPSSRAYNQDDGIGGLIGNAGSRGGGARIRITDSANYGEVLCQSTTNNRLVTAGIIGRPRQNTESNTDYKISYFTDTNIFKNDSLFMGYIVSYCIPVAKAIDNEMLKYCAFTDKNNTLYNGDEYYVAGGYPGGPMKITVPNTIPSGTQLVLNVSVLEKVYGTDVDTAYPIISRSDKSVIEPTKNGSVWTYTI